MLANNAVPKDPKCCFWCRSEDGTGVCIKPRCECHTKLPSQEPPYHQIDHSHCWQSKKPPCGQRIEHLYCCLCRKMNPKAAPAPHEGGEPTGFNDLTPREKMWVTMRGLDSGRKTDIWNVAERLIKEAEARGREEERERIIGVIVKNLWGATVEPPERTDHLQVWNSALNTVIEAARNPNT